MGNRRRHQELGRAGATEVAGFAAITRERRGSPLYEPLRGSEHRSVKVLVGILVMVLIAVASLAATATGSTKAKTINVAIVANGQMQDIARLTPSLFTKKSGIKVKYTILDEGKLRQITTRDVGSSGKAFDAVMIGPYEAPQFGVAGLLKDLTPMAKGDQAYDYNDLIPAVRNALSAKGHLYAAPFYGESSFLMYRKDILAKKGVKMPLHPTWKQVAAAARKIKTPSMAGICLRAGRQDEVVGLAVELGARDPEELARPERRVEVHRVRDRKAVPPGCRAARQGRLGGDPAGNAPVHVPDPSIQEGGQGLRTDHAGGDEGRPDHPPRHHQASGTTGCAIRRHPTVPGCRQSLHPAFLARDRRR